MDSILEEEINALRSGVRRPSPAPQQSQLPSNVPKIEYLRVSSVKSNSAHFGASSVSVSNSESSSVLSDRQYLSSNISLRSAAISRSVLPSTRSVSAGTRVVPNTPPEITRSVGRAASMHISNSTTSTCNAGLARGSSENASDLEQKERAVRSALKQRQKDLLDETKRLSLVDSKLKLISQQHQDSINQLRQKLEASKKLVSALEKDMKLKEEKYTAAKSAFEKANAERSQLTSDLTTLILETEKIRESKLNEILCEIEQAESQAVAACP